MFERHDAHDQLTDFVEHCTQAKQDYKRVHHQLFTVFGAYRRLHSASLKVSGGVARLLESTKGQGGAAEKEELARMLKESQAAMAEFKTMQDPVGLKTVDPMTTQAGGGSGRLPVTLVQRGGGGSTSFELERGPVPPFAGYDVDIDPLEKARGGGVINVDNQYFTGLKTTVGKISFKSFYGNQNALVDFVYVPPGCAVEGEKEDDEKVDKELITLHHAYPFRRMCSELVACVQWCDHLFRHFIPDVYDFDRLKEFSKLKADHVHPCFVATLTDKHTDNMFTYPSNRDAFSEFRGQDVRVTVEGVPGVTFFLPAYDATRYLFHCAEVRYTEVNVKTWSLDNAVDELTCTVTTQGGDTLVPLKDLTDVIRVSDELSDTHDFRHHLFSYPPHLTPSAASLPGKSVEQCITQYVSMRTSEEEYNKTIRDKKPDIETAFKEKITQYFLP